MTVIRKALFIFRRDLRLEDNKGLLFALENAQKVILSFIFAPEQIKNNPYRSDRCLQFMLESLEDLENDILKKNGKLYFFSGDPTEITEKCIRFLQLDAVIVNRDYTPYSIARDKKIHAACTKYNVQFLSMDDILLHPPENTLKSDGTPYTIFTPYYKKSSLLNVNPPEKNPHSHYYSDPIPFAESRSILEKILPLRKPQQKGGRAAGLKILQNIRNFSGYAIMRDYPAEDRTTHLSAHLKFTTVSVRELYHSIINNLGGQTELIRSLYWRDFFTMIAFYFPHIFTGAFKSKFNQIEWDKDINSFELWCEGKTGFPIVDAGMRELKETGFMHNRVRMIVASFLVKDLYIDWRWGEKYFAQHLIDYDPAVNNGNWQWAASTGCDAQPYFRIFNSWKQIEKFDCECLYIKRWVPELQDVPPEKIKKWHLEKVRKQYPVYLDPILDHATASAKTIEQFKNLFKIF